ncbi:hydroxypyruvate reductase [Thalassobaculum fulvum]|uniref:Hydroxypyruvate reductase n=2 Tax=Thalassobaculum fulvum TaxID=1633335 RepID=A0A919CN00_9PROT|nr:hydroxypyruvate reductase [Thalassobaculum fulvum]
MIDSEALLRRMFDAALAAADPKVCLPPFLVPLAKAPCAGRTVVIGAGKAAAAMAAATEAVWAEHAPDAPLEGLVVTRYGHGCPTDRIEVVEAAHPVPDAAGREAAGRILELVRGLGPEDRVVALISGGGSALLALPAEGVTLEDKQDVNRALLRSGASIHEMNAVRKHLSAIKGGRLAAAAAPARVHAYLISDVPGDDPDVIASGPTVPDTTTLSDARAVLAKYGIEPPAAVAKALSDPAFETPKAGDKLFGRVETVMVARPQASLEAAAEVARAAGATPVILGDAIEGEAREVAMVMAGIAAQVARHGQPAEAPAVLLSGGETTVTVRGSGRGGRNAEFLAALAVAVEKRCGDVADRIAAVAGDTDGIDGTEDNAGALFLPGDLARARATGVDLTARLANNDGYGAFEALGRLLVTGPTLTNVNDFRAVLVLP